MRRITVDGPPLITTRRWLWMPPRALYCLSEHRIKQPPYIPTHTGLCCAYREPPGDVPCRESALYAAYPRWGVVAVAASMRELAHISEAGLTRDQAMAYLQVSIAVPVAAGR